MDSHYPPQWVDQSRLAFLHSYFGISVYIPNAFVAQLFISGDASLDLSIDTANKDTSAGGVLLTAV